MYELEFDVLVSGIDEFILYIEQPIYGCEIPPIHFKKSDYDFNGTVL